MASVELAPGCALDGPTGLKDCFRSLPGRWTPTDRVAAFLGQERACYGRALSQADVPSVELHAGQAGVAG
jgi:hypothetical protein